VPPSILKHGTNIVNRGLKVLFSAFFRYFFCWPPPLLKNFLPTPLFVSLKDSPHPIRKFVGDCVEAVNLNFRATISAARKLL